MGALIGIAVQLTFVAVGLLITLMVWTVRLMIVLLGALFGMISSATRRR